LSPRKWAESCLSWSLIAKSDVCLSSWTSDTSRAPWALSRPERGRKRRTAEPRLCQALTLASRRLMRIRQVMVSDVDSDSRTVVQCSIKMSCKNPRSSVVGEVPARPWPVEACAGEVPDRRLSDQHGCPVHHHETFRLRSTKFQDIGHVAVMTPSAAVVEISD
jgi:hypothetical protein